MANSWRSRRARRREYNRYLDFSPVWQTKRFLVRQRSGGWCEWCRARGKLRKAREIHHLRYPRVFGTESIATLVHLCPACHRAAHDRHHLDRIVVWIGVVMTVVWLMFG